MLDLKFSAENSNDKDDFCDIRIWSGDCEHKESLNSGDKYLCDVCETIKDLNHEVRPAAMPYVSGDYESLS